MTREECKRNLTVLDEKYCGKRKQLTVDLFNSAIADIREENYVCSESESLATLAYRCDTILGVMREDLIDHEIISNVKNIVSQRLRTIDNEGK